MSISVEIELCNAGTSDQQRAGQALAAVLHVCVQGGAGVSFVLPFSRPEATRLPVLGMLR